MITTQKHTPKPSRPNKADLEAKRRAFDRLSRTSPLSGLDDVALPFEPMRERMVAAFHDPQLHLTPVVVRRYV